MSTFANRVGQYFGLFTRSAGSIKFENNDKSQRSKYEILSKDVDLV